MAFNSKSINFKAGLDTKGVATGVQQIQAHMSKLSRDVGGIKRSFSGLGKAVGLAVAVGKLVEFGKESVDLAVKAEGIERAFRKLNDPTLLNSLRDATRGTVDDLKLMQISVKASNFKIPLEQLSTYLAFAQQRARETGESVDYLVESIITGLGRQSVMILDNLGLSAAEIRDNMKDGSTMADAVGKMIATSMKEAGEQTDTAADKLDRYKTSVANLKTTIGQKLMPIVADMAEMLNALVTDPKYFMLGAEKQKQLKADAKAEIDRRREVMKSVEQFFSKEVAIEEGIKGIRSRLIQIRGEEAKLTMKYSADRLFYLQKEKEMLVALAKEFEAYAKKTATPPITPTSDPLSLEEQISIAKKSNKALSELESQGLSKAQVQALDTAIAIDLLNSKLSEIPKTLATIDSGLTGKPPLSEFQKGIEEMTENVRSMLEGLVTTIAVDFFGAIGEAMVAGGDSFKSFGQQTLEAMGRFFKQIGAMFISYGIAALEFFKTLLVPANAPALIAAGVALSLIGGAISGAAKNMAQTGQPSSAGVPAQSGGMGYNFETRIDGYDLVLVNDRNQRLRNRRG